MRTIHGAPRAPFGWLDHPTPQEATVKKLFVVLLAAGAGFAAWRKQESGKSQEKLWAEATDKVS